MSLIFLLAMASAFGPAIASPTLAALTGHNPQTVPVQVVLLQDKNTSKVSLTALTANSSGILGRSCSKSLNTGPFISHPIHFDVDINGTGNITIGADSFSIHAGIDVTRSIICNRIDSKADSLVSCTFAIPSSSLLTATPSYHEDLAECFSPGGLGVAGFLRLPSKVEALSRRDVRAGAEVRQHSAAPAPVLAARQDECTLWSYWTEKVGDGDPWQWPLAIQVSSNLRCENGQCAVSYLQSQSFTIGFSISGGGGIFAWIDGGFSVQQTVETGQAVECQGERDETVCVWKQVGRTVYKVRNREYNQCFGERYGDVVDLISPNDRELGTRFYCVRGEQYCRSIGERYDSDRYRGGPGTPCC